MKVFRNRETYTRAKTIFFRVLICVMALCTGLYLRSLTAKPQLTYHKLSPDAKKTETVLMIRDEQPEETAVHGSDEVINDLNGILNDALNAGSEFLSGIVDSISESEIGQQIFTEEELQNIQSISDLAGDMIDYLFSQSSGSQK